MTAPKGILHDELSPVAQKEYDNMGDLDSIISRERTQSPYDASRDISRTSFELEKAEQSQLQSQSPEGKIAGSAGPANETAGKHQFLKRLFSGVLP